MPTYLDTLLNLISPNEANAKIVGDPKSMQLMREMYNEPNNTYLRGMENSIVKAADKRPEQVSVNQAPGLTSAYGELGSYENGSVVYDPSQGKESVYTTMAHELFHFLNSKSS